MEIFRRVMLSRQPIFILAFLFVNNNANIFYGYGISIVTTY